MVLRSRYKVSASNCPLSNIQVSKLQIICQCGQQFFFKYIFLSTIFLSKSILILAKNSLELFQCEYVCMRDLTRQDVWMWTAPSNCASTGLSKPGSRNTTPETNKNSHIQGGKGGSFACKRPGFYWRWGNAATLRFNHVKKPWHSLLEIRQIFNSN